MNLKKNLNLIKDLTVFVAYNTDIDAICYLNEDFEKKFSKNEFKQALKEEPKAIKNKVDLLSGILRSMRDNNAEELPILNPKMVEFLKNNIKPEEKRMGGQAGIMSNLLSTLGCKTIVYTKLLSKKQSNLFRDNENLFFPKVNKTLKLKHPKKCSKKVKTKTNWIFEFKKGSMVFSTKAKGSNRFIAASRPEEINLEVEKLEKHVKELANLCDCAILSGYHDLKKKYKDGSSYLDHLKSAEKFLEKLKKENPNLTVQVEFASVPDREMRSEILKRIVSKADSLSMDRSEISSILKVLEKEKKLTSIIEYYKALEKIFEEFEINCVKIHTLNYFMGIFQDYLNPKHVKKGLLFARDLGASRIKKGEIEDKEDVKIAEGIEVSRKGKKERKKFEEFLKNSKGEKLEKGLYKLKDKYVVLIPTKIVKEPKRTVGAGDIISAGSFALENALEKSGGK